jgi:hypothetical protein
MKRSMVAVIAAFLTIAISSQAQAAPEWEKFELETAFASLSDTQAGAHGDLTVGFRLSRNAAEMHYAYPQDIVVELPPGVVGNPQAYPQCTPLQLGTKVENTNCPLDSQVGVADLVLSEGGVLRDAPIYNMPPPGGRNVARFGFFTAHVAAYINVRLNPRTNSLVAAVENASTAAPLLEASTTFWGVPSSPVHDKERLTPEEVLGMKTPPAQGRSSTMPEIPFMTNPTSCDAGRTVRVSARSYQIPDRWFAREASFPQITGCGILELKPVTSLGLTTSQGTSGTGLTYELQLPTQGLGLPNIPSDSHLRRAEVVLPRGVTINPSQAEGLGVCSEADLARETYDSQPNQGCPETSKIGSVMAESPVIDRRAEGSLYVAKPYENPFGSLLAIYMVLRIPDRGVLITLPGKVMLDPATGQITTVFDDLPQLPVASFRLNFREGARAPLVSPPACGGYQAISNFAPWSAPGGSVVRPNSFAITSGPNFGPCPGGGLPPLRPLLTGGTVNNAAGSYSPFNVHIARNDAEQEITHFSVKLPPGLTAKLAGVPYCSDLAIAGAAGRKGAHGGEEELSSPSCPSASQIGKTLVGVGVGQALTYVPGKLYLAGPYNGAPLSVVAITAAKAGPFDLGTVIVREALRINPETAEVFVDATGSDPIPRIIQGIPTHLRDIRVYVDRPQFALNPTDCTPTSLASVLMGAGSDFASAADDRPVTVSTRFQAADCGALEFKPSLKLRLRGATKRSGNPALRAELRMRPGEANVGRAQVTLPKSQFLEQANIGTVCTRPQFNSGPTPGSGCPKASVYGHARAFTPLLDQPLEGPVFLRSNGGERDLPDLVAALNGRQIDVVLVGHIDSEKGRIRTTFQTVPDAPVSRFVLNMSGGKKSLLTNSTSLCKGRHRAKVAFTGQNGKQRNFKPLVKAKCGNKGKKNKKNKKKK